MASLSSLFLPLLFLHASALALSARPQGMEHLLIQTAAQQVDSAQSQTLSSWFWLIGVLLTLFGSTLSLLGFFLQKFSHQASNEATTLNFFGYAKDWRWWVGLLVWLAGQVLCWVAGGLASRSLLACFNCTNIVLVVLLGPLLFNETVDRQKVVGVFVTLIGCIWVVSSGPHTYHEETFELVSKAWQGVPFQTLVAVSAVALLALVFQGVLIRSPSPLEYAAGSSICAWYSVVLSQCTATLMVTSMRGENQLCHWQFFLFLGGMFLAGFCQMHLLTLGLKAGDTVLVLPAYESLSMVGQVCLCGVFFQEFNGFTSSQTAIFAAGLVIVLSGVVTLQWGVGGKLAGKPLISGIVPAVAAEVPQDVSAH